MTTYKDAGVDIDAANQGLTKIKKHVNSTYNKYTLSDVGGFGGCFQFDFTKYKRFSVDGVEIAYSPSQAFIMVGHVLLIICKISCSWRKTIVFRLFAI